MSRFGRKFARVGSILLSVPFLASGAKTVILQNPWAGTSAATYTQYINQASMGYNTSMQKVFSDNGYWAYTFSSNTPGAFYFTNSTYTMGYYGSAGLASAIPAGFNLDALFATKDTVWIVPDPNNATTRYPSTTTTSPMGKQMVVMYRNPSTWYYSPALQVENKGWANFSQVGYGKWYSARIGGFNSLSLGIRDYYGSYYQGSTGLTTVSTTVLNLDSTVAKNDTVWIVGDANLPPKVMTSQVGPFVVMFKNPWGKTDPGVQPAVSIDGSTIWNSMPAAAGWTGWSSVTVPGLFSTVCFRNGVSGSSFVGMNAGIGTYSSQLALDSAFVKNDTAWVVPSAMSSHSVLSSAPSPRPITLMLRNPWDSANPGQPPYARLETADWVPFVAAPGGWHSLQTTISGLSLQVGIRNATGTSHLTYSGFSYSADYLTLDTAMAKNDTIWIVPQQINGHAILSVEPKSKQGVVMLQNPWEAQYPGLSPRMEIESQGATLMSPVAGMPNWYSAPFSFYTKLQATFWDNGRAYSTTRTLLDTAFAKNDTIWLTFASYYSTPKVSSVAPTAKNVTIMFKSPWDSTAPFLPGSFQVEGQGWKPLAPVSGMQGWYSGSASFYTSLIVGIRDSKATSFINYYGTTTVSTDNIQLDTAYAKNDTVWVVGGAGTNTPPGVFSTSPVVRALTILLQSPWEATTPGVAPSILVNGSRWKTFQAHPSMIGWYSASLDYYGSLAVQVRNAAGTSYLWNGGTSYSGYGMILDTAAARNDTIWIQYLPASYVTVANPVAPTAKPVTIMFKSPWDSTAPFLPGSFQVESQGWKPLAPVTGMAGWYSGSAVFYGTLQVGIRDSKSSSFISYYGTTTLTTASITLDTAYAKNDTVWIVGGAGSSTPSGVFTSAPAPRPLTVILQNPWEAAVPGAAPSLLVNGSNWKAFQAFAPRPGWYSTSLDFYGSLVVQIRNAARTSYLYYGGTISSSSYTLTLDTAYAKNDTIWITAAPAVSPRIYSVDPDPKPFVLMLQNPWQAIYPGLSPQGQVEGSGWSPFTPVAGDTGWYSYSGVYIADLLVGIRLGTGTSYLGSNGTSSQYTSLRLDSLFRRNDTIWITSGTAGKPPRFRSMNPRTSKVVLVFNPWDGIFPLQRPVAYLGGSSNGQVLSPSMEHCGWYALEVAAYPSQLVLRSSGTGAVFGSAGIGSSAPMDLTGNITDTVWVAPVPSGARISYMPLTNKGACAIALLPATVRDFSYASIYKYNTGLQTNLVMDALSPDRKPVVRRGSPTAAQQVAWFRDSAGLNAPTCRDLPMALDTLTGIYRMANPSFYPIDDFVTLPGGTLNTYNDKSYGGNSNNYGFCLESHGQFRYQRGQNDTISGQDDIFQYLNGRLVANLGGTRYSDLSQAVKMDTLGLVDGNVYPWDLFFCDRMSSTSVLNWSMPGLLASPIARVDSSMTGNVAKLQVSAVRTRGQGCDAVDAISPTRGDVRLRALYDTVWTTLASGVHYGGIRVLDSSGVQVDTSALVGLPYGIYVVRLRAIIDSLVYRDVIFEVEPPPGTHPYTPNARCDLLTGTILGSTGCINVSDLDGDTVHVSRNTTRLSSEGLVLCGSATTVVPGTDIAYLLDNSGSMMTSDPTSQRGIILQDAINLHSQTAPGSFAAYLPFESSYTATQLYNLSNSVEYNSLIGSIGLGNGGGTTYAGPLGWARALLQGAKSGSLSQPASPNKNKAIIMISDGSPADSVDANQMTLPGATTYHLSNSWTLPNDSSPPVFGFMITTSANATTYGKALYDITQFTHGEFIVIPPNDPDSLRAAMMRVLGSIVARAKPDTLRITNQTNGQKSLGLSGAKEGSGWRFRLDSLVGLEPGINDLRLRGVLSTDSGDSVVNARWTVVVGDSTDEFLVGGKDTTLMTQCFAATQLKVRPPLDTTRHFADQRDANLSFWLDVRYDRQLLNSVRFWTDFSRDTGTKTLNTPVAPTGVRAYSNASAPWTLVPAFRKDSTIQTDFGWDTLRAIYRTPRDRRDTAFGILPVFRPWPVMVRLSPDTATGGKGQFTVVVRDPNVTLDTVRVKVFLPRRDTVSLLLTRDSVAKFSAKLAYRQGALVVAGDSLLQSGAYRQVVLDSVMAVYLTNRDTALLRRPEPRLRFMDASGKPLDSLPIRILQIGQLDTVRVGLFLDTVLISSSADSVGLSAPSWLQLRSLAGVGSIRRSKLVSGKTSIAVYAIGPGIGGDVRLVSPSGSDTLRRRIDVGGLLLRFRDQAGNVVDTASIDADYLADTLLRVEVWSGGGLCTSCNGWMTDSATTSSIRFLDTLGAPADSFLIRSGRAALRIGAFAPVSGAAVVLKSDALWARGAVTPINFRPYALRYVDASGSVVDSAWVDRDLGSDTLLRVEVWGRSGLCTGCTGKVGIVGSDAALALSDTTGKLTDSVSIKGGRAAVRIGSNKPLSGAKITLDGAILGKAGVVSPVSFRPYRLRYVDASGSVVDSAWVDRDLGSDTLVRVEVWGRSGLCTSCDGKLGVSGSDATLALSDTSGKATDSVSIKGGRAALRVGSAKPVVGARVSLNSAILGNAGSVSPVSFRPYRLRYVDASGSVVDSAWVDRDLGSDTLVRVEVWGRSGLCTGCDGKLGVSGSDASLALSDTSGKVTDSVAIKGGRAALRVGSAKPVVGARVSLNSAILGNAGSVSPVSFRPYRLRYVDGAGKVVDSAWVDRDILTDTLLRVEVWGRSGLCTSCGGKLGVAGSDAALALSDTTGKLTDSVAIVGGRATVRIGSVRPVVSAKVALSASALGASGEITPVSFRAYRLRFVHGDGTVSDSFQVDTLARRRVQVSLQVWGKNGPLVCGGQVRIASLGADLALTDTSGNSGTSFPLVDGRAIFQVRSDIPRSVRLKASIDSLWASAVVGPIVWRVPAPDSAVYLDADGDGGLDRVVVKFALPWNPVNDLVLAWPDSGSLLGLSKASRKVSSDSLTVEWSFDQPQSPRTTAWRRQPVAGRFAWDGAGAGLSFPAIERIAPIPVRSRLQRGATADTLVVWASEPLDAGQISAGADLVRRSFPGANRVESDAPVWDSRRQALILPIERSKVDAMVRPGDSVRFAAQGKARDAGGSVASDMAPSVEVEGLERSPVRAVVYDMDADGRADRVVLHFERPPQVVDGYRFRWPARDGKLQEREAAVSAAHPDSSGRVLSFDVAPWEFASTQCDSVGCDDLGALRTTRWGDTLQGTFALEDGVLPVIVKAQLRLRRVVSMPDTLRATMSETVNLGDGASWLRYGRPSKDSLGLSIERLGQSSKDGRILELLLDSTFAGQEGDSLRLAAWPDGGIEDDAGNRPGRFVHWTALEIGVPRVKLLAMPWPPKAVYTGWTVPPTEPPLSVFVRSSPNAPWKTIDGKAPGQETSHYAGILLRTNKALEGAVLYLYDNTGVSVALVDLADVQKALRENKVESSLRGDLDAWIAWNGMSRRGTMAPSGVYLARIVGWVNNDGRREVVNKVYNIGWHNPQTPAPPPDLEYFPQFDWSGW